MQEPRRTLESLRRLGIEEVKERLELSTLSPAASTFDSPDLDKCCCCKINPDPIPDNPHEGDD